MKDKKLQVFVSSTYADLIEERQAAVEAILSAGHIPAGMELFSAGDESQMTVIERWIDESDVYLLILGGRYGSIEPKTGKSYTHLEYEYAVKQKKPLFAVVISEKSLDEKVRLFSRTVLELDNVKEFKEFKSIVLSNLVKFWDDKKDIKLAIHETLSEFSYVKKLTGWIRGDNNVNMNILAEEIARLTKENADLRDKLNTWESNISALYSGLSYAQMKELLQREKIPRTDQSVYEFFIDVGPKLSKGVLVGMTENGRYEQLLTYKLVNFSKTSSGAKSYFFTDDGHNFYLKNMIESKVS